MLKYFYDLYYFSLLLWLSLFFLELIWPRIVLAYFNLNYLLIFCVFSGIFLVLKQKKPKNSNGQ